MDVWRGREGFAHFLEGLGCVEIRAEEEAIGLLERIEALAGEAGALEADGIQTVAARFAGRDDFRERRNILGDDGVGADVGVAADAAELLDGRKCADGGVIIHGDVAGESGAVDEDRVAADLRIVADVRVGHDEIAIAEAGDAAAFDGAAIYGGELAKRVVVADLERDALIGEREILGIAADYRERVEAIILAEARRALNDGVMIEDAAVTEFDFIAYDGECSDADSGAEPHTRRNDGMRMDFDHGIF